MGKVKITLVRSTINRIERHKRTVRALGLKKMHRPIVHEETPQIRGMINQVKYLLKEEAAE